MRQAADCCATTLRRLDSINQKWLQAAFPDEKQRPALRRCCVPPDVAFSLLYATGYVKLFHNGDGEDTDWNGLCIVCSFEAWLCDADPKENMRFTIGEYTQGFSVFDRTLAARCVAMLYVQMVWKIVTQSC